MKFDVEQSVQVLRRTPDALRALLGGLGDGWTRSNYGPDTFSPYDVVGHLIHADQTNWMSRIRLILNDGDDGEAAPLPPFDRYAMFAASAGKSTGELLETFALLRAENVDDLVALDLTPAQLARAGTHPQLGRLTVGQLIAAWVVHDLGHLHQIAKAMAYQYRDEVGPLRTFLTILPKP